MTTSTIAHPTPRQAPQALFPWLISIAAQQWKAWKAARRAVQRFARQFDEIAALPLAANVVINSGIVAAVSGEPPAATLPELGDTAARLGGRSDVLSAALAVRDEVEAALDDAELVMFMMDAREGVTSLDRIFAERLRRVHKPVILLANKSESRESGGGVGEAHGLGFGLDLPRQRQARRRQRRPHPPRAAEGLGGQPTRSAGEGAEGTRTHPDGIQPGGR